MRNIIFSIICSMVLMAGLAWSANYLPMSRIGVHLTNPDNKGKCESVTSSFTINGRQWCAQCKMGYNAVLEAGQIYCVQCPEGSSYKIIDGRSWCVK
jgi:hypothetical protein